MEKSDKEREVIFSRERERKTRVQQASKGQRHTPELAMSMREYFHIRDKFVSFSGAMRTNILTREEKKNACLQTRERQIKPVLEN